MFIKQIEKRIKKGQLSFFSVPLIIFSLLYLPNINSIPYLDGNIDLIRSYDFYVGGFNQYFQNWGSVHPPLKLFITNFLFHTLGLSSFAYNLIGYVFGIIGIISIYKVCETIFDKKIARIATILLATYPLFIATGIFGLTDYLVSVLILASLAFYTKRNYLFYGVFASLAVLTKETAMLFPFVVLFIDIIYSLKQTRKILKNLRLTTTRLIYFLSPIITYYLWDLFIQAHGQKSWNDWNFSATADRGSIYTIVNNLITFNFLNPYAYQHWKQVFILNFNWILWIFFVSISLVYILTNLSKIKNNILSGKQNIRALIVILLFCLLYIVTVLSFQTYTIPRYALPLLCLFLIGLSWSIAKIFNRMNIFIKIAFSFMLAILIFIRLFNSVDPISLKLWGQEDILKSNFFALNNHLAGNDGITYNMEYVYIASQRSSLLKLANKHVLSEQCGWIFPDPNNDYKTVSVLKLKNIDLTTPCLPSK